MDFLIVIIERMKLVIIDTGICIFNGQTIGNGKFNSGIVTNMVPMSLLNRYPFKRLVLFDSSSMMKFKKIE